ncbi:MAG TPA: DoxX family membrane protein [Phycisphaerales bacterium]|nr:DoxX family membrane protein [Phycisphaerales bacterium]
MACKCTSASLGPLILRTALAVVFIWAGLTKVLATTEVTGKDVTLLKEMGVTPKTATVDGVTGTPAAASSDKLEVSLAYTLALHLRKLEQPQGEQQITLWPKALTQDRWPVWAAYACTFTELVGGALLLIGGLTRLAAFGIATTMMTAMWLTVIGPAIASGKTHLGFLPDTEPLLGGNFMMVQFQFTLCLAAWALVFLGCGALGLDNALFGRGKKPSKPKPAAPAEE